MAKNIILYRHYAYILDTVAWLNYSYKTPSDNL